MLFLPFMEAVQDHTIIFRQLDSDTIRKILQFYLTPIRAATMMRKWWLKYFFRDYEYHYEHNVCHVYRVNVSADDDYQTITKHVILRVLVIIGKNPRITTVFENTKTIRLTYAGQAYNVTSYTLGDPHYYLRSTNCREYFFEVDLQPKHAVQYLARTAPAEYIDDCEYHCPPGILYNYIVFNSNDSCQSVDDIDKYARGGHKYDADEMGHVNLSSLVANYNLYHTLKFMNMLKIMRYFYGSRMDDLQLPEPYPMSESSEGLTGLKLAGINYPLRVDCFDRHALALLFMIECPCDEYGLEELSNKQYNELLNVFRRNYSHHFNGNLADMNFYNYEGFYGWHTNTVYDS